jgi:hypothetical protein
MSIKAGHLLWNRRRLELAAGDTNIDTGLIQVIKAFAPGEPTLGESGVAPPPPATGAVSRVQVIPMAPITGWTNITHSEPYLDTTTNTIHVVFTNAGALVAINVLFWIPHTINSPGSAEHYNGGVQ